MKRKIVWLVVSSLMVLALLAASCAPAVEEAAPPAEKPAAPAAEVAPAEKPAAPAAEMVKLSLTKLDGTVVEKMVEKPRYGGELILMRTDPVAGWDSRLIATGPAVASNFATNDKLLQGNWARGPAGTEEASWAISGMTVTQYEVGDLAESWEIVQPDTLIYHIRHGVHFGLNPALEPSRLVGGREITADDILWQLRQVYFETKTSGHYTSAGVSRPVDAYATDKWTVVVKALPDQLWMTFEFVTSHGVMYYAPEVAKKYGDFKDWTRVVGTGPFILTDYVAMNQITWVRNPNYWMKDPLFPENQLPYVDKMKMLTIPDASTRMAALRTGRVDLDYTRTINWEDAASLKKTSPQLKFSTETPSGKYLAGRIDKPELPFKDIRVRRALMMAINQQEMVDTYFGGNAYSLSFPVPFIKEYMPAYTPLEELGLAADGFDTKKLYGYHPAEAKQLLAAAGYPKGFKTEVVLLSEDVDLASMVKAYWAEIGVDLAIDVKDPAVHTAMRVARSYKEMYFFSGFAYGAADKIFHHRTGATMNMSMVSDPKIDEGYLRMGAFKPWSPEWTKALKDLNLYIIHRVDNYPLPLSPVYIVWQPWLKGFSGAVSSGGHSRAFQKYVWIDQALKKAMGR